MWSHRRIVALIQCGIPIALIGTRKVGETVNTKAWPYKSGVNDDTEVKTMLREAAVTAHELIQYEREAYPYEAESAIDELEYTSRDGFIPNSYNHGGFSVKGFETVEQIVGSGSYPASAKAREQIEASSELNYKYALEALNLTDAQLVDQTLAEKVYEKQSEMGQDDTIMFQVVLMYHGVERGVHSATVQVAVNWEHQYHRSRSSNEDYIEVKIAWRKHSAGLKNIVKAVKQGVTKLF